MILRARCEFGENQRELGWKPQHAELEDIIRSAWSWMQQNPNGYGSAR